VGRAEGVNRTRWEGEGEVGGTIGVLQFKVGMLVDGGYNRTEYYPFLRRNSSMAPPSLQKKTVPALAAGFLGTVAKCDKKGSMGRERRSPSGKAVTAAWGKRPPCGLHNFAVANENEARISTPTPRTSPTKVILAPLKRAGDALFCVE